MERLPRILAKTSPSEQGGIGLDPISWINPSSSLVVHVYLGPGPLTLPSFWSLSWFSALPG